MARTEIEGLTTVFNNMTNNCYKKCINNPSKQLQTSNLDNKDELCIDSCVSKYMFTQFLVADILSNNNIVNSASNNVLDSAFDKNISM